MNTTQLAHRRRQARISPPPLALAAAAARVQGYQMRDEDYDDFMHEGISDHHGGIRTAVRMWLVDGPTAAKARYGPIASWDTSAITDMYRLFYYRRDFNEDISRWNVSNVKDMRGMFAFATSFNGDLSRWNVGQVKSMECMFEHATSLNGDLSRWEVGQVERMNYMFNYATSFTHQLGGAWATSTAHKYCMFYNSPGIIAGKTKHANGTIA